MKGSEKLKTIPYYQPNFGPQEMAAVKKVLRSGWVQTGPIAAQFSDRVKEFCQASHVQLTNSATAGLFLTLQSLGIGSGDQVITSPYTFVATANAIVQTGATVVFADPEDLYNLGPQNVISKLTSQTKAIICVDFAGVPCDYPKLFAALESHYTHGRRPALIADASHSFGSSNKGIPCGSLADFTVFSFHAVKNITTCDGGAIVANQYRSTLDVRWDALFASIQRKSLHGLTHDALSRSAGAFWEYDMLEVGYKYNMTDVSASLGVVQLESLPQRKLRRKKILSWYQKELRDQKNIHFWEALLGDEIFPHILPIQVDFVLPQTRENVLQNLKKSGIICNIHYKPIPCMTGYQSMGHNIETVPRAQFLYEREMTLPLYERLTKSQVTHIARTLSGLLPSVV